MKRSNKAEDFLRLMKSKQEIELKIENQRKLIAEKSMILKDFEKSQDFNKFKMEIFKEVNDLLTKMNSWIIEGMSKEDISWILAFLKDKKDDRIISLMEEAKQTYINEVFNLNLAWFKINHFHSKGEWVLQEANKEPR